MIPTDKVVSITINTEPRLLTDDNLSLLLLVESDVYLPTGNRFRKYTSTVAVGQDRPSTSEGYKAALEFFAQYPNGTMAIARRFATPTAGEILGGAATTLLATWNAIATGALKLSIDGTVVTVSDLDFTEAATMPAVAAIVQTAIDADKAGVQVTWTGSRFYITSGTTGAASSIGFSTAPASGTDIGGLLGFQAASLGVVNTVGALAETIQESLDAILATDSSWYPMTFTNEVTDQNVQDAAAWAEANYRLYQQTTNEVSALDPTNTTDIGSLLQAASYSYSSIIYDPLKEYAAVSYLARLAAVNPKQADSMITMMFKTLPGITPAANLTPAQAAALDAKNINYYTYFGNQTGDQTAIVSNGTQASGMFTDTRYGLDWLKTHLQTSVFNYQLSSKRVTGTDKGVARIVHTLQAAMLDAVSNGFVAEGVWNGDPLATPSGGVIVDTGDTLKNGFYVYGAPVATAGNTTTRVYSGITILVIGAGAIQGVQIAINFQGN
jgi:hypothetical protein